MAKKYGPRVARGLLTITKLAAAKAVIESKFLSVEAFVQSCALPTSDLKPIGPELICSLLFNPRLS